MQRESGILSSWNDERGFGFVTGASGSRFFVHISAFRRGDRRPVDGDRLEFSVERAPDGRLRAVDVRGSRSAASSRRRAVSVLAAVIPIGVFAVVWLELAGRFSAPLWLLALYVLMSVITFFAYAHDKAAARRGTWRESESTLLALGLLGGWPGAVIARQVLRHKTRKQPFRSLFWVSVIVNIAALAGVLAAVH